MHTLILYQMPKSGRWRWKFCFNSRILARADHHYESPSAARRAFKGIRTAWPYGEKIERG